MICLIDLRELPSDKHTKDCGKSACLLGKLTVFKCLWQISNVQWLKLLTEQTPSSREDDEPLDLGVHVFSETSKT